MARVEQRSDDAFTAVIKCISRALSSPLSRIVLHSPTYPLFLQWFAGGSLTVMADVCRSHFCERENANDHDLYATTERAAVV